MVLCREFLTKLWWCLPWDAGITRGQIRLWKLLRCLFVRRRRRRGGVHTGTLLSSAIDRATGGSGDTRTVHRKYVRVRKERQDLRIDLADWIVDASEQQLLDKLRLDKLSSMSLLECMKERPEELVI